MWWCKYKSNFAYDNFFFLCYKMRQNAILLLVCLSICQCDECNTAKFLTAYIRHRPWQSVFLFQSVKLDATQTGASYPTEDIRAEGLLCDQSAGLSERIAEESLDSRGRCNTLFFRRNNPSGHISESGRETNSRCETFVTSATRSRCDMRRFKRHEERFSRVVCFTLNSQTEVHIGEGPLSCKLCKKTFSQRSNQRRHLMLHTGERLFSCDMCENRFTQRSHLITHFMVHTGERPFSCVVCKESFARRFILMKHLKTHKEKRIFICEVCKKLFDKRSDMVKHIRLHKGYGPFSCKVCKKTFVYPSLLERHLTVHSGERHFTCEVCKKKFSQNTNLKRHLKLHIAMSDKSQT
jgi:stress-induced morphogen